MRFPVYSFRMCMPVTLAIVFAGTAARADVNGFGDFSNFTINRNDTAAVSTLTPGVPPGGSIQLTNTGFPERRSIFYNTPQSITQFTASFTYQSAVTTFHDIGVCFVVQNMPRPRTPLVAT